MSPTRDVLLPCILAALPGPAVAGADEVDDLVRKRTPPRSDRRRRLRDRLRLPRSARRIEPARPGPDDQAPILREADGRRETHPIRGMFSTGG